MVYKMIENIHSDLVYVWTKFSERFTLRLEQYNTIGLTRYLATHVFNERRVAFRFRAADCVHDTWHNSISIIPAEACFTQRPYIYEVNFLVNSCDMMPVNVRETRKRVCTVFVKQPHDISMIGLVLDINISLSQIRRVSPLMHSFYQLIYK